MKMRDTKQMVRWALLLMATAALVALAVPNIGFGQTLNDLNHGTVQKITTVTNGRASSTSYTGRH
jgi:hypothetical protein